MLRGSGGELGVDGWSEVGREYVFWGASSARSKAEGPLLTRSRLPQVASTREICLRNRFALPGSILALGAYAVGM